MSTKPTSLPFWTAPPPPAAPMNPSEAPPKKTLRPPSQALTPLSLVILLNFPPLKNIFLLLLKHLLWKSTLTTCRRRSPSNKLWTPSLDVFSSQKQPNKKLSLPLWKAPYPLKKSLIAAQTLSPTAKNAPPPAAGMLLLHNRNVPPSAAPLQVSIPDCSSNSTIVIL